MTEAEWLACGELLPLLDYLSLTEKASDRKWRLFACASCRRIWDLLADERCTRAIEVAEKFADGLAVDSALQAAHDAANDAEVEQVILPPDPKFTHLRFHAATFAAYRMSGQAAYSASGYSLEAVEENEAAAVDAERPLQVRLLHDVFDNPFRPSGFDAARRTATALSLAQAAYDERELPSGHLDNARLAVLADALEEAGCTDTEILSHLRSAGPHVRGCWALDLVLGKG